MCVPTTAAAGESGAAMAWGGNESGQLGSGNTTTALLPQEIGGLSEAVQVAGGEKHGVALLAGGTVMTWGNNEFGQLGNGTSEPRSLVPTSVGGLTEVTAVAAGGNFSLALRSDGTVVAWGENSHGQLGDGTTQNRNVPVPVSGLGEVVAIAAGRYFSLARLSDGKVVAWGRNNSGQLGNGTSEDSHTPVPVAGLSGVTAIAAGTGHSLALVEGGGVWAWGSNFGGALGDGGSGSNTEFSSAPVAASGLSSGVTSIAAGEFLSLAVLEGGGVMSWGLSQSGDLGDGANVNRTTPGPATGLTEAASVAAGSKDGYVLMRNGTEFSFGENLHGELGTGSHLNAESQNSNVPVRVCGMQEIGGIAGAFRAAYAHGVDNTTACPVVDVVSPGGGPLAGGTTVTITGTSFTDVRAVTFGATNAVEFSVNSPTSITAVSPPHSAPKEGEFPIKEVRVTVITGAGSSPVEGGCCAPFFSYYPPPSTAKIAPNKGPASGGTRVLITGTNLYNPTDVKFGAVQATKFEEAGTATGRVQAWAPPEPAGTVDVTVTTPGGTTPIVMKDRFKFVPVITSVAPSSGPKAGGTSVTVNGSGFAVGKTATTFKFGTAKATSVNCASTTECTMLSPAHAAGAVDIVATANKAVGAKTPPGDRFTYE
jgi:alpha-tubulin suppressor-like RCC1 family protein